MVGEGEEVLGLGADLRRGYRVAYGGGVWRGGKRYSVFSSGLDRFSGLPWVRERDRMTASRLLELRAGMMGEFGALMRPGPGEGGGLDLMVVTVSVMLVATAGLGGLTLKVYLVWWVVKGGRSRPDTQ